jgi:myo-inositol-1(or 4)-monophosphatase|tara:strand:- start:2416 stop:3360 length:945 start_codon:yes stop_codon:yes gene_type:complete
LTAPHDDAALAEIELFAIEVVNAAGKLVSSRFGGDMDVESKDGNGANLVTDVDRTSQSLIAEMVQERFPGHMVLGEEDAPKDEPDARDYIWCVDPIDGTTNFVNGHPVYAVSIGVLYRGEPVAAAVWTPWPADGGYEVMHARKGGGAWIGDRKLAVKKPSAKEPHRPKRGWLSTIPGSLRFMFKVDRAARGNLGEPRTTGSAVYEMAMVARGVLQYALTGAVFSWDLAAGILLVKEAGGIVLTPAGPADRVAGGWVMLDGFSPGFENTQETTKAIRGARNVALAGAPEVVWFVSRRLKRRRYGRVRRRMRRWFR